jgi:hypothetical protein
MKVRCIRNRNLDGLLTTNKIYDVVQFTKFSYIIVNDVGILTTFLKDGFISLKEERSQKLSKLIKVI